MKTTALLLLVTGALGLVMCSNKQTAPHDPSADAAWLEQLTGKWAGDVGGMRYVEEWRKVDATTYEATAVTAKDDQVLATEQIRITLFSDHWLYLANPGGQGVTCFVRHSAETDTWIFENREHDFPKRIGYRIKGNALTAWIAGANDEDERRQFDLVRVE